MEKFKELERYSFHATWKLERNLVKSFDILARQIDEHILDETHETFVEEGYLFKSFLYMSGIGGKGKKDMKIAKDCLKEAIKLLEKWKESPKKDGFYSVAYALEAWLDMNKTQERLNDLKQLRLKHNQMTKDSFEACNHYIRGFALSRLGNNRYDECIVEFRRATEKCPDDVEYLFSLAFMTGRSNELDVGVEYKDMLLKVLEKKPDYLFAKVKLADLACSEGNKEDAINILDDVTSTLANTPYITPENMKIIGQVMKTYLQLDNTFKAQALYLLAEEKGKVSSFVKYQHALMAYKMEKYEDYEKYLSDAVEINPQNLLAKLKLTKRRVREMDADEVIEVFHQIARDHSGDEVAVIMFLAHLGNMLIRKNWMEAAIVEYENAIDKALKYFQCGKLPKVKFVRDVTVSVKICVTNLRACWKTKENRSPDKIFNLAILENKLGNLYLARSYCNEALKWELHKKQREKMLLILKEIEIETSTDSTTLIEVENCLKTIKSEECRQNVKELQGKLSLKKGILSELKDFPFDIYTYAALSGNVQAMQRLFSTLDIMDNTSSQYYQTCASLDMSIENIEIFNEKKCMEDRLKIILEEAFTGERRQLRKQQFLMEKQALNSYSTSKVDIVIQTASNLLNQAMQKLSKTYRSKTPVNDAKTLDFFCIYDSFNKEQIEVESKLKEYGWDNVDPELIRFLVEIQPSTNPEVNDWSMALKKCNNSGKNMRKIKVHREDPSVNQIDLARTVCNKITFILDTFNEFSYTS